MPTYFDMGRNFRRVLVEASADAPPTFTFLDEGDRCDSAAYWAACDRERRGMSGITAQALGRPEPIEPSIVQSLQAVVDRGRERHTLLGRILTREIPATWVNLRRLAELGEDPRMILAIMHDNGMGDHFEPSAELRAEDDEGDDMGAETDAMLGMGEAEQWFRERVE